MRPRIERGPVVIIGGAEDREGGAEILREFVRLAGGARARIGVIAAAFRAAVQPDAGRPLGFEFPPGLLRHPGL